jgi:hypothetical protein
MTDGAVFHSPCCNIRLWPSAFLQKFSLWNFPLVLLEAGSYIQSLVGATPRVVLGGLEDMIRGETLNVKQNI